MLPEPLSADPALGPDDRTDRSMLAVQYGVAIVAALASILLAIVR